MGVPHVAFGLERWKGHVALFPRDIPDDFGSWPERARAMRPSGTGMSFEDVMSRFQTPRQRDMMLRLVGFSFEQHPGCPLPDSCLEALDRLVRENARAYARLPVRPLGEAASTVRSSDAWRSQDAPSMPLRACDAMDPGPSPAAAGWAAPGEPAGPQAVGA